MSRIRVIAQFACVLLLLAIPASAQRPQRPPDGGNSLFYEAMREVFQEAPNKELFDLASRPDIRDEVALSPENAELVRENAHGASKEAWSLKDQLDPNLTKDELKTKIREVVAPRENSSYKILEENSKFERLLGIYAQVRNNRAILNEHVAKKVGMEEAALKKFRETRVEAGRALWLETSDAVFRVMRNAPRDASTRADIEKLFKQAEEKLDKKLGELLTQEQKAKLEELKGVKLDLPSGIFDRPPRRPPGGGPAGEKRRDPDEKHRDGKSSDSKCTDRENQSLVCL